MAPSEGSAWRKRLISADAVLEKIQPGMSIFIGTGTAEPRALVKQLMASGHTNLQDLTLIQMVSFGDAISLEALASNKYRLKTFFPGSGATDAITDGQVDLIPTRFSNIARLMREGQIPIDVAFVQITPPDASGYCSLGVGVDITRQAMARADLVVGEINARVPFTFGDTFVPMDRFDYLIESSEPPLTFPRWPVDPVFDQLAANVASVIEDGACLGFTIGPLFEALPKYLSKKKDLGVHTPFFTDALMDLVGSGAVSNRKKGSFRGKSLAAYALGTDELLRWLDRNPMVEFQRAAKVFTPMEIGRNRNFVLVLPARRVDLSGRVALHFGQGNVTSGPGQVADFLNGAEISPGGYAVVALPSRNREGRANVRASVQDSPNLLNQPESVDMVVTEYGVAHLRGRTLRERAQALIEIAHPDERPGLVAAAKAANLLYADQIFLADSAHLYPADLATRQTFKNDVQVRFRAIKPSDEEPMRRLFYRFSDEAIYYRYFSPIKTMPHTKMQTYVNVDYATQLSIVGLVGPPGQPQIVAEARYARHPDKPWVDVAFVVDEDYQGLGIATFMLKMLIRLARQRRATRLTADVLASNKAMLKVFEKSGMAFHANLEDGVFALSLDLQTAPL